MSTYQRVTRRSKKQILIVGVVCLRIYVHVSTDESVPVAVAGVEQNRLSLQYLQTAAWLFAAEPY